MDGLLVPLAVEIQDLCHNDIGDFLIDRHAQIDNAVLQEHAVYVIRAAPLLVVIYYHWDQIM
jgi:hypothetical protein